MMNTWHDLELGKNPTEEFTAVIEVPTGSRNKYELDKKTGLIKLDRVLYSPLTYPADYGFLPRTYCDDKDPLDVLVIVREATYPGVLISCRPIGVMKMIDGGEQDDKILAVPVDDPFFKDYLDLSDVPEYFVKEVRHFFEVYKELQNKKVQVTDFLGAEDAKKIIQESIDMYNKEFGSKN